MLRDNVDVEIIAPYKLQTHHPLIIESFRSPYTLALTLKEPPTKTVVRQYYAPTLMSNNL